MWDAPFHRIAYWNKFGMPESIVTRTGSYTDLVSLWWLDPQKSARLDQAMNDASIKFPVSPLENRFWQDFAKKQGAAAVPVN
jgi:microcin C transport system substrate-binding protein